MLRIATVIPAILFVFGLGCGGGGGGTTTDNGSASDTPTADNPVAMVTFKAELVDFQTKAPVEGADVTVLDNATGKPTGITGKSGAKGMVELQLPATPVKVGFKVSMADNKDTYQFNIDAAPKETERLWLVSVLTYTVVPKLAGITVDKTKGIVAGGLYFVNDKGEEENVGCATIESTPAGDYRYFDPLTSLPVPPEKASATSKGISYYLAANVPEGTTKVAAKVGGTEVGSVNIFTYPDSICISNIYVKSAADGGTNPTPADCK